MPPRFPSSRRERYGDEAREREDAEEKSSGVRIPARVASEFLFYDDVHDFVCGRVVFDCLSRVVGVLFLGHLVAGSVDSLASIVYFT